MLEADENASAETQSMPREPNQVDGAAGCIATAAAEPGITTGHSSEGADTQSAAKLPAHPSASARPCKGLKVAQPIRALGESNDSGRYRYSDQQSSSADTQEVCDLPYSREELKARADEILASAHSKAESIVSTARRRAEEEAEAFRKEALAGAEQVAADVKAEAEEQADQIVRAAREHKRGPHWAVWSLVFYAGFFALLLVYLSYLFTVTGALNPVLTAATWLFIAGSAVAVLRILWKLICFLTLSRNGLASLKESDEANRNSSGAKQ